MRFLLVVAVIAFLAATAHGQGFFARLFGGGRRNRGRNNNNGGGGGGGCSRPGPNYRYHNFGGRRYLPTWELGELIT